MPVTTGDIDSRPQRGRLVVCILISLLCCGFDFAPDVGIGLDASWMRIMNEAHMHHWVFGRDIVFTYGPLAMLDTHYSTDLRWLILGADLSIAFGYCYLMYRYMPRGKLWLLLLLPAIIIMRYGHFAQLALLLFILYIGILLLREDANRLCAVLCGFYAGTVFYVKVNYGLIVLFLLPIMIAILLWQRRRYAWWVLGAFVVVFGSIWLMVDIDMVGYIKNSLPIIANYEEAMFAPVQPGKITYKHAMYLFVLTGCMLAGHMYDVVKNRKNIVASTTFMALCLLYCFLAFKNSFVRYDLLHSRQLFATYPFLFMFLCGILGYGRSTVAIIASCVVIALSAWALPGDDASLSRLSLNDMSYHAWPENYYKQLFSAPRTATYPEVAIGKDTLPELETGTVDIFPHDAAYLLVNGLHYRPRPIPQSYSAYSASLDMMNARHFVSHKRPQYILERNASLDGSRYAIWDESVTKAALHLNYTIHRLVDMGSGAEKSGFVMLKEKADVHELPRMKEVGRATGHIGDTVWVPYKEGKPLYMTADVRYTLLGKVNKLLLQPMPVHITLIMDGHTEEYRLVLPIAKGPVLISHLVDNDLSFSRFLSGEVQNNERIRGFRIDTHNKEIERDVPIVYYVFDNY
ncbi:hypothetical protein [Nemorincola caseinilytica]